MKYGILAAFFALLSHPNAIGQYLQIEHINTEQGLPAEEIHSLLATPDNYLWLAASQGLYRYDGYQYQAIKLPPTPEGLPSGQLFRIRPKSEDELYLLFSNQGFCIYNTRCGSFEYFQSGPGGPGSLPSNFVYDILDDGPQAWLLFDRGGFGRFDKASKAFKQYLPSRLLPPAPRADETLAMTSDPNDPNRLWVASVSGLMAFDKQKEKLQYFKSETSSGPLPSSSFRQLVIDGQGLLYASTFNDGVWCFDTRKGKWLGPLPGAGQAGLSCVNFIGFRQPGELWISDEFLGLFSYDIGQGRIRLLVPSHIHKAPVSDPNYRLQSSIMSLQPGPFGAWWGIQRRKGLAAIYPSKQVFPRYHFPEEGRCAAGLPGKPFIYINTNGRLAYRMDLRTGALSPIPIEVVGDDELNFSQCQCTPDGRFWFIGRNAVYYYEEGARAARPLLLPQIQSALDTAWADSFLWDSRGRLWLGTNHGLLFVDPGHNQSRWITFADTVENHVNRWRGYKDLLEAPGGRIWFAADRGFGFTDDDGRTFTRYNFQSPASNNAEFAGIYALARDNMGRIWLGSRSQGIGYVLDNAPHPQRITIINTENGLPSNQARALQVDANGSLWVLQDAGLSRLGPRDLKPVHFGPGYGKSLMRSFYLSTLPDGQMTLGAWSGFHLFDPGAVAPDTIFYPLRLQNLRVFDSLYLGETSLMSGIPVRLKYRQNFFTIEFMATHYGAPGPIQYQYMLEGWDSGWRTAGNNRYAAFSNVREGNYTFRLRASNTLGEWPEKGHLALQLGVSPPWWRSWWFRPLAAAGILGLIFSYYRYRIRQVKKEEAVKTEFNRRVAELEMESLRAQMNPHFLFNSLQSIKWYLIHHSTSESADYLDKFAQLIRKVLQNTRSKLIRLSEELEAAELYLQLEQYRFKKRFDFSIEVEPGLPTDFVRVPPLLFQPFLENAIWHGLMQKEEGQGHLHIRVEKEGQGLRILIRDNGIGREKAKSLNSRSASKHQSLGISLSQGRFEALNKMMGIEVKLEIIDLKNEAGAPAGTLVEIGLPAGL